jgi:hypothetical protein
VAFVLNQSQSYSWPVSINLPADGGKREKSSFDALFKRLPQSRINEIQQLAQQRIKSAERGDELDNGVTDQSIAAEILVGWSGILDADGDDVPYSEAVKAQLLDVPMMAGALIEAYFTSLVELKRKN